MASMYAKLMGRITESSLMEEPVMVRYVFMMMLAIADPRGYVIGTHVAIARRMNVSVAEFEDALRELMEPDPDSNSKEHDGRRVIPSDGERGYFLVNYVKYRDTRDEEQRREYMREYMRKRRESESVNSVNTGKPALAKEEVEVKEEAELNLAQEPVKPSAPKPADAGVEFAEFWKAYPRKKSKGDAMKAFKAAKCSALMDRIIPALAAAKASHDWTKEGGKYIPYPASWIRDMGWEDQPIELERPKIKYRSAL